MAGTPAKKRAPRRKARAGNGRPSTRDIDRARVDEHGGAVAVTAAKQLTEDQRALLADLFAVVEEHAASRSRRWTETSSRARSFSPASATRTSGGRAARTSSSIRWAWPRSAPGCASTPRRSAPPPARHGGGHQRVARRGGDGLRRRGGGAGGRRHQALGSHLPEPGRPPGRELPQDDGGHGPGHPVHPDRARRPPAQHAHAGLDAEAEAAARRPRRRWRSSPRWRTGSASTPSSGSWRTSRSTCSTRASSTRSSSW